jgi:hypothetical protein
MRKQYIARRLDLQDNTQVSTAHFGVDKGLFGPSVIACTPIFQ